MRICHVAPGCCADKRQRKATHAELQYSSSDSNSCCSFVDANIVALGAMSSNDASAAVVYTSAVSDTPVRGSSMQPAQAGAHITGSAEADPGSEKCFQQQQ